jgi:anaerobic ribonucleoside-triphosphate reductase
VPGSDEIIRSPVRTMAVILAILGVSAVLIAYVMIEQRISLRSCPECGFRVSIDGLDEDCPRCGAIIPQKIEI